MPQFLFFRIPATLAFATSLLILLYISSTSNLFFSHRPPPRLINGASSTDHELPTANLSFIRSDFTNQEEISRASTINGVRVEAEGQSDWTPQISSHGPCHDTHTFHQTYNQMNRSFNIYVYPAKKHDPFANILLPVASEPGGNYASESYFKRALFGSHFLTADPATADLFFLPFSVARLRHDPRVGAAGVRDFVAEYVIGISRDYPFWNRSGGADHFYVACHSVGRSATGKAGAVRASVIQGVCSSSYYLSYYVAHKDASLPQVWPRRGDPPNVENASFRTKLAFFAGSRNSPVREKLLRSWGDDSEISVHSGRLPTPYPNELLTSKFCLHVKGFEVNTARIGDALHYGCVPVVIANHYDLPFQDILDWHKFSIVVATFDIPLLKKILKGITEGEYAILRSNVLKARKHFQWHISPVDYDAFYMVMYELWLRRSSSRLVAI